MNLRLIMLLPLVIAALPSRSGAQLIASAAVAPDNVITTVSPRTVPVYIRPSQATMVQNYSLDAFGPYPIVASAFTAGLNQFTNSPPEWRQGVEGYSKRFGSDVGIVAVATTSRYGLAEAFKEDTLYYRCECRGIGPRMRHAVVSTLTARRGDDGHRVFSIPALIAPYAGTMTAVYAWFPNRYGAKDAFRMGNYSMLGYVGENISLEFLYSGPRSLFARMHLNDSHGAPDPGPNH
ncbi:MAG: hypothetical protein ABSF28_15420 [Terracidiphilus sp.]